MYEYKATVTSVYDGDTITVDIDLGFNCHMKGMKIRLMKIDAPEVRGDSRIEGLRTRDWLRTRILGREVRLSTYKDKKGKYGRWLALVFLAGESWSVNNEMVSLGLAVEKDY